MSINRICISGNLTRDPELRATPGGMSILQIGLAVNDRRKIHDEWVDCVNYVDVIVFGKRAEALSTLIFKGSKVYIEGKLRWSEWTDKNSGDKRSKIEVVADDVEIANYQAESYKAPAEQPVFEDDIPF